MPGEGYYLDPGVPAAQTWLVETVLDVVRHYGVDGIHLDYLRYPTGRQDGQPIAPGYNPIALQRYAAETGALGRPAPNDPRWQRWRADQPGQLVRRLYASALAVKPQLKISAAVPPEPAAAYAAALCDWPGWLRDHWLDAVAPMNFLPADQNAQFAQRVDQALDLAAGRHVYIGQAGYLNPSENSLTQLRSAAVRPIQGLIVFSYAYPIMSLLAPDPEAVARFYASVHDSLFAAPAPPPAMPWKTRPTTGLVQGVVRLNGVPIEGATLQLGDGPALARSDGNGYYALNELPPSKLRLTASAPNGARLSVDVTPPAGRVRTVDFALT